MGFFKLADGRFGGRFSIIVIILLHILINLSVSSLSLYLGYALSTFSKTQDYDILTPILIIMGVTFAITCLGKYISAAIFMSLNRNIHH